MIYASHNAFPGTGAIFPVFGTALILLAGKARNKSKLFDFLSKKALLKIGLISYSLYLWHWPLLAIAKVYNLGKIPSLSIRLAIIALSFILAYIGYSFIEKPVRQKTFFKRIRLPSLLASAIMICFLIIFSAQQLIPLERYLLARNSNAKEILQIVNAVQNEPKDRPVPWACMGERTGLKDCEVSYGGPSSRPSTDLLLWGDSHAQRYMAMVDDYVKRRRMSAVLFSRAATPPLFMGSKRFC